MSEENIEIVHKSIDAINSGDVKAVVETFDPDATFEPLRAAVQGTYRGHAGIRDWLADTRDNFAAFRLDITDIRDLGDNRVLSVGSLHLRGRESGVETDVPTAAVATLRNGKVVALKDYGDRRKALEAAGLSEAMSEENVEVVRAYVDAYNAGGDAYLDFVAEEVEIVPDASRFTEAKPFRGREEYRRYIADIDQDWEGGGKAEIKEIFPVGDDRVVTRTDWGGRGRASGIDLRSCLSSINTVREGQITKIEFFFDHDDALEVAGLSV